MRYGYLTAAAIAIAAMVTSAAFLAPLRPAALATNAHQSRIEPQPANRVILTARQSADAQRSRLWPGPVRSLLAVGHPMTFGEWRWDDRGVPNGSSTVRIDLSTQLISVLRGGHEVGTSVILYGGDGHPTPVGRFPILSKVADYHSQAYDAPMPFALRFTADGVALHGSDVRSGRATHGCIGLPLPFARKLFALMHVGDEIMIVRSRSA